jgi:FkbM family methyltransferase
MTGLAVMSYLFHDLDGTRAQMNIEEILHQIARRGDTILDVGGHVGNVAWFMTRCVGPDGKVFSFEPHPEKFKALNAKARKYAPLQAFNCAVSNSLAPVTLYFGTTEESDQASTICADLATRDRFGAEVLSAEVPATTLDKFCTDHKLVPSIIKIDVEGAEPFVLEGADAVLDAKPILIFEMGISKTLPDHLAQLRARGYELYFVDIHRFISVNATFNDVVNTETRAMRNCIISFTDSAAEGIAPFLSNVLAVIPGKHTPRLAGLRIVPLAEALPHFADPKKSLSGKIKHLVRRVLFPASVEQRYPGLVMNLRKLANRIL